MLANRPSYAGASSDSEVRLLSRCSEMKGQFVKSGKGRKTGGRLSLVKIFFSYTKVSQDSGDGSWSQIFIAPVRDCRPCSCFRVHPDFVATFGVAIKGTV
jgi:hypothetical protein